MKLNTDIAKDYAKTLLEANEAWFYDYHVSDQDAKRYMEALDFFTKTLSKFKPKEA